MVSLLPVNDLPPAPPPFPPRAEEVRRLVRMAGPLTVAQVGLLMMGLVDTWMVGRLGPTELAAVALGDACFFTVAVLAMGLVMAIDPLVSQAWGAGEPRRCAEAWTVAGRLSLLLGLPLSLCVYAIGPLLLTAGLDAELARTTADYVVPRGIGGLPLLLYQRDRCLLHGLGTTRPTMVVTLLANLFNAAADYGFVFGAWGLPTLGVAGCGLATSLTTIVMWLALAAWGRRPEYAAVRRPTPAPPGLWARVVRLGLPLGLSHALEVGAFAASSYLVGLLGVAALAAHQIAIKMASTSFMFAVALGIATGVRVGHEIGAGRPEHAKRIGWLGLGLGLAVMGCWGLLFLAGGRAIVAAFSPDPEVIRIGVGLLAVAAAFQLSDGTQAILSGALRGAGDTLWPLLANLAGHWFLALPLAAALVLGGHGDALGVWACLAVGLTATAALLLARFVRLDRVRPLDG